jgi:uncharacterized SAM-binding protein YcdF (DUF218 family)
MVPDALTPEHGYDMVKRVLSGLLVLAAVVGVWFISGRIHSALVVSMPLPQADAIILLAGAYPERAPTAARLFREGIAPRIILTNDGVFSSWSQQYQRNLYNIEWATELLVTRGVPRQAIVHLPYIGSGTIYDAAAVRTYCRRNGIGTLLLVTSDYHSRRALWTFRYLFRQDAVTIGIVPVPTSPGGLRAVQEVVTEMAKGAYYWLRYGICRNFGLPLS